MMMNEKVEGLITSQCYPIKDAIECGVFDKLNMGRFITDELIDDDLFIIVASMFDQNLVYIAGCVNKENKRFSTHIIMPVQDLVPQFDFAGLVIKHFDGYRMVYSPVATLEEEFIEFIQQMGLKKVSMTSVSGEFACPPADNDKVKSLADLDYLSVERLRTVMRFQSVFPENTKQSLDYYESIDNMFEEAKEYRDISAVAYRDGMPAGFALVNITDQDGVYRLAFVTVFPGFEDLTIYDDMIQHITHSLEKYGCTITLTQATGTRYAQRDLSSLGYVPYTINFERK